MSFRFRAAAPADVEAIADVYLASWRAGYEDFLPHDTLEKQAAVRGRYDWLEAIESPSAAVILGIESGHVVGVVEAREELPEAERDLPEITMLYVAPTLWATPLATQLLAAGCSWIRERGHHVARLREPLAAWVAEDGPHIVGHVALHAEAPREVAALVAQVTGRAPGGLAFVARLLVTPSHRRRGIGRELLDLATRAAHRRSRWPVLDVATTFRPAIQLYEAAGWTCAGSVTVEIPREQPHEEFVYLGHEPPDLGAVR